MDPNLVVDADKQWTCQVCLNEPPTPEIPPDEQGVEKITTETVDENISKPIPKTASPLRKSPKRKRTLKFAHRKRSKLKNKKPKIEEIVASTESEESELGSLSDVSPSSSPVKEPDYKTLKTSFKTFYVKNSAIQKRCPTQGCDGKGHLTGKFSMHHTVSGCPKHHDMTAEECRVGIENYKLGESMMMYWHVLCPCLSPLSSILGHFHNHYQ